MLLAFTSISLQSNTAIAEPPINYINLPSDATPLGVTYCSEQNLSYVALTPSTSGATKGIAVINVTKALSGVSDCYEIYEPTIGNPDESFGHFVVLDGNGDVWCMFFAYPYGNLTKFDTKTRIFTITNIKTHGYTALYYVGFLWTIWESTLLKINYTTTGVVERYNISPIRYGSHMIVDTNYIWISDITADAVVRFNILTEQVDLTVSGLNRPLGLAIKDNILYVAENKEETYETGEIKMIDKTTGEILGSLITAEITQSGPYMVYVDSEGNLWWSDNSQHVGFFGKFVNITYPTIGCMNYYMTEVQNHIFFSGKGSAHVGMLKVPKEYPWDVYYDHKIDMRDVAIFARAFGSYPGHPRWNPEADVTGTVYLVPDGKVDMRDVALVARHFGEKY
jgi:hypothetical protein